MLRAWGIYAVVASPPIERDFCLQAILILTQHPLRRGGRFGPGRRGVTEHQSCNEGLYLPVIIRLRPRRAVVFACYLSAC